MVGRRAFLAALGAGAATAKSDGWIDFLNRHYNELQDDLSGESNPNIERLGNFAFRQWEDIDYDSIKGSKRRNKQIAPIASYRNNPNKFNHGTYFFADTVKGDLGNLENAVSFFDVNPEGIESEFDDPWIDAVDLMFQFQRDCFKKGVYEPITEAGLIIRADDGALAKTVTRDDLEEYAAAQYENASAESITDQQFNDVIEDFNRYDVETLYFGEGQNDGLDWYKLSQTIQDGWEQILPVNWRTWGNYTTRGGYVAEDYI